MNTESSPQVVIELGCLCKRYAMTSRPLHNLWRALKGMGTAHDNNAIHTALHPLDLTIHQGEVVGIVGLNGAGKSTLLQLVAKTIKPSEGSIKVEGKVGAILELGAGFNPEFTGRENARMALAISNTSPDSISTIMNEVIEFADIGVFIDQPIKTYSSGMLMRLAFAVATSQQPEVLIVDEALSVGDGGFARKSFDRIMRLKESKTTILFCSHSLFQIEALCNKVLWLHEGKKMAWGAAKEVLIQYDTFLLTGQIKPIETNQSPLLSAELKNGQDLASSPGTARFLRIHFRNEKNENTAPLNLISETSSFYLKFEYASDPKLATPTIALTLKSADGQILTSSATFMDRVTLARNDEGFGTAEFSIPNIPLLKGSYFLDIYLMCEKGIFIYDSAAQVLQLNVEQESLVQGRFILPHKWTSP